MDFRDLGRSSGWRDVAAAGHPPHGPQKPGGLAGRFRVASTDRLYDNQERPAVGDQWPRPDVCQATRFPDSPRAVGDSHYSPLAQSFFFFACHGPGALGRWDLPVVRATFDSSPEKVALFLVTRQPNAPIRVPTCP